MISWDMLATDMHIRLSCPLVAVQTYSGRARKPCSSRSTAAATSRSNFATGSPKQMIPATQKAQLQKAWARAPGKQTMPWQSLGDGVSQPRRSQVAKQELAQVADGRVHVRLRRVEVAKLVRNDVLLEKLFLVWRLLQSQPSSLE